MNTTNSSTSPTSDITLNHLTSLSSALLTIFTSSTLRTPISSKHLLIKVIGCLKTGVFKLSDLGKFERALEKLSLGEGETKEGEAGVEEAATKTMQLTLTREPNGHLTLLDVVLPSGISTTTSGLDFRPSTSTATGVGGKRLLGKRKRVVDEEADSAAGSGESDDEDDIGENDNVAGGIEGEKTGGGLAGFSKEQREVYKLVQLPSAKRRLLAEEFRSSLPFEPICRQITKAACSNSRPDHTICSLVHFRPLIRPHTDPSLGHCSYLNTCYSEPTYAQSPSVHPVTLGTGLRGPSSLPSGLGAGGRGKEKAPCRYLHFEVDWDGGDGVQHQQQQQIQKPAHKLGLGIGPSSSSSSSSNSPSPLPPQWINCDLRKFDLSLLGQFHIILADPPWDIHMSLPYGTLTDDEMRSIPLPSLQPPGGLLFLWVTGRAMEVGRECLRVWGYMRVDEVVWVKTNQLQRVIRTGRTGHWLNHTKEHMLVAVKMPDDSSSSSQIPLPSWANRGLDTDVLVSEVRETSRKPEEVYGLIERICPGGRKLEIFGRKHNVRPGWLTLGNQLGPDEIWEEDLARRVKARYPDRPINIPSSTSTTNGTR
ncbi:MT-A70-domain-containing protein [Lentinula raphanica]|nr:MT-A70-domain-containing protein [Lentinula raphanica]